MLELVTESCIVVFGRMLISILSVSVKPMEKCVEAVAAGEPLPQAFLPGLVFKVLIGLVVELLMILDKVHNNLLN